MSAAESLGSHQLNSFAAFLEEKLHTSSENSIVQIPHLKKMAEGKRPQKGGKRPEVMTAFEIPEDIYAGYCTPDESKFGKEDKNQRKVRIQRIERRWAREWREYRYVTPKYMKKFAVNPPCPRPPLAPGQVADPTSIRRGEDFPQEWAKRQRKLQKQAKEAVRKFNEESAAAATEASAKPRKSMMKKPARKPSASPSMPSWPSSSAAPSRPESSKSSKQIPHAAPAPPKSSAPPAKSSAIPTKSSAPVHLASCQRTTGISIASGVSASSSAAPKSSAGPSLLKKKATAGRGTRPSPKKQVVFSVPSDDDDDADEEELAEIIRDRQERAAKANSTPVPMLLDPRAILDYIDLWHKDPNTPMPDFKLTPGQSHMLTHFIQEEKWKYDRAREIKKSQYRKEKLLKKNVLKMKPEELVKMQAEIKALSDNFDSYYADWQGAKVRFVRLTDTFTKGTASKQQIPQAEASVQQTEEHASTADEVQAAEENASSKADDSAPAVDEIARASTSGVLEENEETRATASVVPEENEPDSSAPPAPTPTPILPSALDVKKTKAAERATVKKRKASSASESSAPKKMKPMTRSFANPIDAIPISSMPSKDLIPFGEEYVIPSGSDEETQSAALSEQIDEEIEVDTIPSTPIVSSPMPQFTAEEASVEELEDEDVDIGSTTPVMNGDFWESQHPNSPLFTPLQQIPHSPAPTFQMGSEETHPTLSVREDIPATCAEPQIFDRCCATRQLSQNILSIQRSYH